MLALLLTLFQDPVTTPPASARFEGSELVVRAWLTLGAVDARGRRPFRPDAVVARYLVGDGAGAPAEGETLKGESGEASWTALTAGEDGRVGEAAWGYAEVASARAQVALARLDGATTMYVNGEPHTGDPYGFGFRGVPVALVAGVNRFLVTGARGAFRLSLAAPPAELFLAEEDLTLPSIAMVESGEPILGLKLVNASLVDCPEFAIEVGENPRLCADRQVFRPGPVALGSRRVALRLKEIPGSFPPQGPGDFQVPLTLHFGAGRSVESRVTLSWRRFDQVFVHTRVSPLDGSVQKFAVLPPKIPRAEKPLRLLLSLHGAGVDCEGQASSYAQKDDFVIVAPTNRRPFGFDWQDWGRLDAYETLAAARSLYPEVRDGHVFLGGHSMGGHGTWHLAANDPGTFTAIAPSAGWRSFDTYGSRPAGALRALWHAADAASNTEALLANLAQPSVYVLHGEADDNVPASEGHAMVAALKEAGAARVQSHFEPGAGHWWDDQDPKTGAGCLDWAGFFELFRKHEPTPAEVGGIKWISVDPGIDAEHHWARVEQPLVYGQPFRVSGGGGEGAKRWVLATENVRRLALGPVPSSVRELVLDGEVVPYALGASAHAYLRREGKWEECSAGVPAGEKSPAASGPLKRAFAADFVLVVPTKGSAAENAAALARARFDQEQWSYRGNGDAEIVTDAAFLALDTKLRNAILYGNRDTNAAWSRVVPVGFQVGIARGAAAAGDMEFAGDDLGLLAVGPRADAPGQLFALLGASGVAADRVASTLALFVSGVGYPDYVVFGGDVLTKGDGGVRAAGFFDAAWKLQAR